MAIPAEYPTSNPIVRDKLALLPIAQGNKVGDFVAPDEYQDSDTVDVVTTADHSLELDDLRAPDAEAKMVRFENGTVATLSVVERAFKARVDSTKVEQYGKRGNDYIAEKSAVLRTDILDAKEYRIAALLTTTAGYSATHKDTSGQNFRTIDLPAYVDTNRNSILNDGGFDPRRALIGPDAWLGAQQNAAFRSYAGASNSAGGTGRVPTLADLASYLNLDEIRIARFRRKLGQANATTSTNFWPLDFFLMFAQNLGSLSNRTFAATLVVPYGKYQAQTGIQGAGSGAVDVRVAPISGTDGLIEYGTYHRYRTFLLNANNAHITTGIVRV